MLTYESDSPPFWMYDQPKGTASPWFPLPPYPKELKNGRTPLTQPQRAFLRFLCDWHWRWCPTLSEIAETANISKRAIQRIAKSLRDIGVIDWIPRSDRTLHLTPVGQSLVGLYIGPIRTNDDPYIDAIPVWDNVRAAHRFQKKLIRARSKEYDYVTRKIRGITPFSRLRRSRVVVRYNDHKSKSPLITHLGEPGLQYEENPDFDVEMSKRSSEINLQ